MSLIALTERLRAGRSVARTMLLLIALTGAVIVGLLAMHSLNTHTAAETGHHATMTTDQTVAGTAGMGDAHAPIAEEPCADCGTGDAGMLAMACLLAVLATLLLIIRPSDAQQWLARLPRPGPLLRGLVEAAPLRPPSLTSLCISRT
ncbi:DUF6153 family protein [Microbacterium kunmingense]|uniref:DUF6153 family protein n=1 Tax=Microbacterium kunmingense TaxID=2915939 RepID=UPI003D74AFBF